MRLLNTKTFDFGEFYDEQWPEYAILSHRWGEQEVSFQDFEAGNKKDGPGYAKLLQFRSVAAARGHAWIWMDTCCIDKKSSAELSEAINSMFRWYRKATVCYAYLVDVPPKTRASKREREDAFNQSKWFQRGWTLQELLAPTAVIFCDQAWDIIGTKATLSPIIAGVSGIRTKYLESRKAMHSASVAVKMSWASQRQTTRTEDMAYCLLGLFDVNMPLLYGENRKAFMRLQLEIIKKSDDESVFAWKSDDLAWGMLAPAPIAFKDSWNVVAYPNMNSLPYSMTNKGLEIHVPRDLQRSQIIEGLDPNENKPSRVKFFPLSCAESGPFGSLCVRIEWQHFGWQRVHCNKLYRIRERDVWSDEIEVIRVHQSGL